MDRRVTPQTQIARCEQIRNSWDTLIANHVPGGGDARCVSHVLTSIEKALETIPNLPYNNNTREDKNIPIHVLCTGSIHLIGGIFKILDPSVCDR